MRIPLPVSRKKPRIEIIPLIDIVFFLLAIFVMVSLSMVRNQGIDVQLPAAASSQPLDPQDDCTISVAEDGRIYVNEHLVSDDALPKRLRNLKQRNAQMRVIINGDERADLGRALMVLDEVRLAGINKVSMRTKPKPR